MECHVGGEVISSKGFHTLTYLITQTRCTLRMVKSREFFPSEKPRKTLTLLCRYLVGRILDLVEKDEVKVAVYFRVFEVNGGNKRRNMLDPRCLVASMHKETIKYFHPHPSLVFNAIDSFIPSFEPFSLFSL